MPQDFDKDRAVRTVPRRVRELRSVPDSRLSAPEVARLLEGRLHDPYRLLGRHADGERDVTVRAFRPRVIRLDLVEAGAQMQRVGDTDLFEWRGPRVVVPERYQLRAHRPGRAPVREFDPYCFPPQISDEDLLAFSEGRHDRIHRFLGAHVVSVDGVQGVRFSVWAPNAERVSVVGSFNDWDGRSHPMCVRGVSGVWELFVPGLGTGETYKYEIRNRETGELLIKSDPCATATEHRPATASVVAGAPAFRWHDSDWLDRRAGRNWLESPVSVYEVHLGSWRRSSAGDVSDYRDIAFDLADYVTRMGFTHVELMPVTEYPLDESWGYQPTGYFAPTSRFGSGDGLRALVDQLHHQGIGVILDWVPGHFPRDPHGLSRFDGTPLYEYPDSRKAEHPDWGTLVFNYSRNEVRSFLLSSALHWLEDYHFDGLRVDAVASMLYLDYSRKEGEWTPNAYGGRENLEAVSFLKALNEATHREFPGTLTIAEESTAWPGVTTPTHSGGLGFTMKWNMGWMHDTLSYMHEDPIHRRHHHDKLTFGPLYAFTENFALPLSHDEVVHGKGSLLGKMPGDEWQRFANLRLLYAFQWTYPGKKHLFMGQEFGQPSEWDHGSTLPWHLLDQPAHAGVQRLVADLNRLYKERTALHERDCRSSGFQWLAWEDREQSVIAYLRRDADSQLLVVLNFTPAPRHAYRVGVPRPGVCTEVMNTDSRYYGGSDVGNPLPVPVDAEPVMGQPCSISVTLPPLAAVVFELT